MASKKKALRGGDHATIETIPPKMISSCTEIRFFEYRVPSHDQSFWTGIPLQI